MVQGAPRSRSDLFQSRSAPPVDWLEGLILNRFAGATDNPTPFAPEPQVPAPLMPGLEMQGTIPAELWQRVLGQPLTANELVGPQGPKMPRPPPLTAEELVGKQGPKMKKPPPLTAEELVGKQGPKAPTPPPLTIEDLFGPRR